MRNIYLQILYPSVTCDHKVGYQAIPTWAWQGRKVQTNKQTNKKTTTNKKKKQLQTKK